MNFIWAQKKRSIYKWVWSVSGTKEVHVVSSFQCLTITCCTQESILYCIWRASHLLYFWWLKFCMIVLADLMNRYSWKNCPAVVFKNPCEKWLKWILIPCWSHNGKDKRLWFALNVDYSTSKHTIPVGDCDDAHPTRPEAVKSEAWLVVGWMPVCREGEGERENSPQYSISLYTLGWMPSWIIGFCDIFIF